MASIVNPESIRMAVRGILANRMRSLLTMLGILIGVAAVIILVAVGSGSAEASRKRLEALGSNVLTVRAGGFGGAATRGGTQSRVAQINDNDVAALKDPDQAPDVADVVPTVNGQSVVGAYKGASATPAQFQGSTPNFSRVRNYAVQAGSFFTLADYDDHALVAVAGTSVAQDLLGDGVNVGLIGGEPVRFGSSTYTVIGLLAGKGSNGFQDLDSIVVVPLTTARDTVAGNSGRGDTLTVQARTRKVTDAAQAEVSAVLGARHPGTSGTFRAVARGGVVVAGQEACSVLGGVVPRSAFGGVGVEVEEVVEALLGGFDLGEHSPGAGSPAFALVEQHGFLDPAEGVE